MSDGAFVHASSVRVRAISFTSSAALVLLALLALFVFSRVVTRIDPAPIALVEVEIASRAPPVRNAPRASSTPPDVASLAAPPTPSDMALDREQLAYSLRCFTPRETRPPDCPPYSAEALAAAGGVFPGARREAYIPPIAAAQTQQSLAGIPPPLCGAGSSGGVPSVGAVGIGFCIRFGVQPAPPSRSPEEICLAGGIGPCRPPAFRPEDVVRLGHTQ